MSAYDEVAVKQRYGRKPPSDEVAVSYIKAVKVIIGADGEIAEAEIKALRAGMKRRWRSKQRWPSFWPS